MTLLWESLPGDIDADNTATGVARTHKPFHHIKVAIPGGAVNSPLAQTAVLQCDWILRQYLWRYIWAKMLLRMRLYFFCITLLMSDLVPFSHIPDLGLIEDIRFKFMSDLIKLRYLLSVHTNTACWYFLCAELLVPEECVEWILLSCVDFTVSPFCTAS